MTGFLDFWRKGVRAESLTQPQAAELHQEVVRRFYGALSNPKHVDHVECSAAAVDLAKRAYPGFVDGTGAVAQGAESNPNADTLFIK